MPLIKPLVRRLASHLFGTKFLLDDSGKEMQICLLISAIVVLHAKPSWSTYSEKELKRYKSADDDTYIEALVLSRQKRASDDASMDERQQLIMEGVKGTHEYIRLHGSSKPHGASDDFDCKIKKLAFDFAVKLIHADYHPAIFDGLELGALCNMSRPKVKSSSRLKLKWEQFIKKVQGIGVSEFFVDPLSKRSNPSGSIFSPFYTISEALQACRQSRKSMHKQRCLVHLRGGTHILNKPLIIGHEDSGTVITGYQNEKVHLSGGLALRPNWKVFRQSLDMFPGFNALYDGIQPGQSTDQVKYVGHFLKLEYCHNSCAGDWRCTAYTYFDNTTAAFAQMCFIRVDGMWSTFKLAGVVSGKKINIYSADLGDSFAGGVDQIFVNGRRAVRARFPNANPETMGLHTAPTGYVSNAVLWLPPAKRGDALEVDIASPTRDRSLFPTFQIGIGGPVQQFDPPQSYWGTKDPVGGGGATYQVPSGLVYDGTLEIASRAWKNASTGIVHAYQHYHWGNWMFKLDSRDQANNVLKWTWGGFQEARGATDGKEWYVENIFEELDTPNEWFYDESSKVIYFFPNTTDGVPEEIVIPQVDNLVTITGTQGHPVRDFVLRGLTLQFTKQTFLKPYMVPSGGDWSVHRNGMVFAEGTENLLVENCVFDQPGGNGLFLSNYHRNATVQENVFYRLGDNGIVLVGDTNMIDGTTGDQPRGSRILYNLIWENGIWGKQTYSYCQSRTAESLLEGNVFFNGPRAAININDGFGGGNDITSNLLFNFVRETDDHGPINTWDRVPYLQKVVDGQTVSLFVKENTITYNMIVNNYRSVWPIDHDDGSCFWADSNNYLVYGGYKNYLGHDKQSLNNYYIYPDLPGHQGASMTNPTCIDTQGQTLGTSGYAEAYMNNHCIIMRSDLYRLGDCDVNNMQMTIPFMANNRYYTAAGNVTVTCGSNSWSLDQFQARGFEIGTRVSKLISDEAVIQWGRDLLGL